MFNLLHTDPRITRVFLPDQAEGIPQAWEDRKGQIIAYTYRVDLYYWMHWPDAITFRFQSEGEEVLYFLHKQQPEEMIQDLFWRSVAPLILQVRGMEVLHASAVKTKDGIVAICAPAGTGKSTLAYGLSRLGFPLWTDDALVFYIEQFRGYTICLPTSFRLLPDTISFFSKTGREQEYHWNLVDRSVEPVKMLIILERADENSITEGVYSNRLPQKEAFLKLLPHAYSFNMNDPKEKKRIAIDYLDLAEKVPVIHVSFQANMDRLTDLIDHVEDLII